VIGETAVLGDNISMLHSVTLGGCGTDPIRRHPLVHDGVLIASGAKLLGPIDIGTGAKIAAGSVVLNDVPAHATVAGVPARVVGKPSAISASFDMDQQLEEG
jgi:serine O-acetyltransferase